MKIQALMRAAAVTSSSSTSASVRLEPVATAEENKSFSVGTPRASIELEVNNPEAMSQFVAGENYVVTFAPATGSAKTAVNATEAVRDTPNAGGRAEAPAAPAAKKTATKSASKTAKK